MKKLFALSSLLLALPFLTACDDEGNYDPSAKRNIIVFIGDGMGTTTITGSRIYHAGEDGQLTMDTLPETAWVRTYSNDAQVTDSAPSAAAYMTGVKMNNEVISMSADTVAVPTDGVANHCGSTNGKAVSSLFEQAIAKEFKTGVVTTTRVTHATPAAAYAHICHRDIENDIAAQLDPLHTQFNKSLKGGLDVVFGGGRKHFVPKSAGGARTDDKDILLDLQQIGYSYLKDSSALKAYKPDGRKVLGLFNSSHMSYELDRDAAKEPSLAEMTGKAIDILAQGDKGFALMVEGGRIDHALHGANAKRAFEDTIAFDNAIKTALDKVRAFDPELKNTLIVVTADHDHTMVLNGYAQRTGKTTTDNAGVLGLVKNVSSGQADMDADGVPYSIIGFGTGPNRVANARHTVSPLTDSVTADNNYVQESTVKMSSETHGGTDVPLMAIGLNAEQFHGFMTNTEVFPILQSALGLK